MSAAGKEGAQLSDADRLIMAGLVDIMEKLCTPAAKGGLPKPLSPTHASLHLIAGVCGLMEWMTDKQVSVMPVPYHLLAQALEWVKDHLKDEASKAGAPS